MRRLVVLTLLLVAMYFVLPLGTPGFGSEALLALGLLILGAYAAGELAGAAGIPQLVGYIVAGMVFGPSALGIVTPTGVAELAPVSALAIALIAFLAGSELRWRDLRQSGAAMLRMVAGELGVTFILITVVLVAMHSWVPFLANGSRWEVLALSLLFASIAVANSPAVMLAMMTESGAEGPLTRTALGVVLLSDVVVVLMLTGVLAVVRHVVPSNGTTGAVQVGAVAWEVTGAVGLGIILGGLVALYLRFVHRELFFFAILVTLFGSEIARVLRVEPLLMLIVAGFVTEALSPARHGAALRQAMERAAAPVFVVFFALAGAGIVLADLAALWPLVLPLVVTRGVGIWCGCFVATRRLGRGATEGGRVVARYLWTALIPQAGVAIGLATIVREAYPDRGGQMQSLFLAMVAVNQLIGPVLLRRALTRSGETAASSPPLGAPGLTAASGG